VIGVPLVGANKEAKNTIEHLQPLLDRSHAIEFEMASLQSEVKQAKERRISSGGFLKGPNESIAAAQLQNQLKITVEGSNGELKSSQVLPAHEDGEFRRITVRGQALMSLAALQHVVYDLEASVPYLFLENIEIAERNDHTKKLISDDPLLDVSFDLSGFVRKSS
jgi:general secretion pathway protein M